jgi:hypothetical protein
VSAADATLRRDIIDRALKAIGADRSVVRLDFTDQINSDNFEYADLLNARGKQKVGAVVEKDGSPLVYLSASTGNVDAGAALARTLGNRAETAILLDVQLNDSGVLAAEVWPCRLDAHSSTRLNLGKFADARSVLGDLQEGLWGTADNAYQEQALRNLLVGSVDVISQSFLDARGAESRDNERGHEVLALVGRALFTRFLLDRRILTEATAPTLFKLIGTEGEAAFATPAHAAATCAWLDQTFNGDFMPLPAHEGYDAYFAALTSESPTALTPIGWIVGRTNAGGQLPLWDRLDFSHIPAGTLSEVYEDYARRKAPGDAKRSSVHFTPRHIARTMVRQTLAGLPEHEAAFAKVLDPAVGAAVFLSLAYRELARLRAIQDGGQWPDTVRLRSILYSQLQGLDINGDALNLAALTLYLTSIELDANPAPPEKLRFSEPLIGTVLRKVGDHTKPTSVGDVLGSLRDLPELKGKFDIVVGNPPWTSISLSKLKNDELEDLPQELSSDPLGDMIEGIANGRLQARGAKSPQYAHPDKVPDLAFLWKATEWAREGGVISMIMHQRLLTKQSGKWRQARRDLFDAIELSGFLDASEFANHEKLLWPGIEAPFCIVFARNQRPAPDHRSLFLSLAVEPVLTKRRQLRIDPMSSWYISADDFDRPGGLIARTKGSELDAAFLVRLQARFDEGSGSSRSSLRRPPLKTLGSFVEGFASQHLMRGIKKGDVNAKIPKWMESFPANAKLLTAKSNSRVAGEVHPNDMPLIFEPGPIRSGPTADWFTPPMLLITQKMGREDDFVRSAVVFPSDDVAPVVFPFAWCGAPFKKDDAYAMLAAKYCAVWVNSSFYAYFHTLTSTQFGFGIKALLSEDIESTPIVDLKVALEKQLTNPSEIDELFDKVGRAAPGLLCAIDTWVSKIAGLDASECALIRDTLSVAYPIGKARQSGMSWVTNSQFECYVEALRNELTQLGVRVDIASMMPVDSGSALRGWRFVRWKLDRGLRERGAETLGDVDTLAHVDAQSLEVLVREKYPQGEVWARTRDGEFVFGQLALKRLWLPSRAILAAQVIIAWVDQHSL